MIRSKIVIPREVLLVEIERRCNLPDCNARNRLGLMKEEARSYTGFECEICKNWNRDALSDRDVPEWWDELAITGMIGVRQIQNDSTEEQSEVVARMSNNYRMAKNQT